jgi:hypothetical protein
MHPRKFDEPLFTAFMPVRPQKDRKAPEPGAKTLLLSDRISMPLGPRVPGTRACERPPTRASGHAALRQTGGRYSKRDLISSMPAAKRVLEQRSALDEPENDDIATGIIEGLKDSKDGRFTCLKNINELVDRWRVLMPT